MNTHHARQSPSSMPPIRCGGDWVPAQQVELHLLNGWRLAADEANAPCPGCGKACVLMLPPVFAEVSEKQECAA